MIHRVLSLSLSVLIALAPIQSAFSSQGSLVMPTTGTISGLTFSQDVSDAFAAIVTCNSGASAPANATSGAPAIGQCWDDTSTTPTKRKVYDGASWLTIGAIDGTNHVWVPPIGGGTATLLSSATVDLCSVPQSYIVITGTTTITSFSNTCVVGTSKDLKFAGVLQITYDSTSMVLPSSRSITTTAGDYARFVYLGGGNWAAIAYTRADGSALTNPAVPLGAKIDYTGVSAPTGYVFGYGQGVSRATYPDYLAAVTSTQTATRTNGSRVLTGLSDTSFLATGMPVEGTGIPSGSTISTVDSASQITLNTGHAASSSGTGSIVIFPLGYGSGGDSTTVGVFDCRGVVVAGRGNMGGTDAALLTSSYFGAVGTGLNSFGGVEYRTIARNQLPNVTLTSTGSATISGAAALAVRNGLGDNPVNLGGDIRVYSSAAFTPLDTLSVSTALNGSVAQVSLPTVQPTRVANCIVRVTQ